MVSHRLVFLAVIFAGLPFAACSSNSQPQGEYCGSSDPCGCLVTTVGQVCVAQGTSCTCTNIEDSGTADSGDAEDSGTADSGDAGDAPAPPDMAALVGNWSPISGSGQANCGGQVTSLPPNTGAILTFTQDSSDTLKATSSGAGDCLLELFVSGEKASLAQSLETCPVSGGGSVSFTTFTLVFTPGTPEGGTASGGGVDASNAEPDADGASSSEDAGADGASSSEDAGADGASSSGDAGADGGASSSGDAGADGASSSEDAGAPQGTLDWQLADTDGNCVTTLHYTLVRAQ
jgi:hypothetical protein